MSNLTKKQIEVEERERRRISKDLHDSLGQQLSGIKLYLGTLDNIPAGTKSSRQKVLISKSLHTLDEAIGELSAICFNLMPVTLKAYGLVYAVEDLAHKMSFIKKVTIKVTASSAFPALDKTLEINIFRVIQEFINNSLKHGNAKHISLNLQYDRAKKGIRLMLKDDGKGFKISDIRKYDGMGLKNVKSRIHFHGGTLDIKSTRRSGTTYEIIIPLKKILDNEKNQGFDN